MTLARAHEHGPTLERIVRLAVRAARAPIGLLALPAAGGGGHALAAAVGLPETWTAGTALDDQVLDAAARAGDGPLAVADLRATPRLRDGALVGETGAVAALAAPLRDADGVARGTLCAFDARPRAWTEDERDALAQLAAVAAGAQAQAATARGLEALREVSLAVASGCAPDEAFALVARVAARALGADAGIVVRYDDERTARVVGSHEPGAETAALACGTALPVVDGGIVGALRSAPTAHADGGPGHRPYRWRVGAAVRVRGRAWGFVAALADGAPFRGDVEQRLRDFAELVGAALRHHETRTQLGELARTDPLTGLANRRAFRERLVGEVERARRHRRNLGLALIDLDGFKLVNDTYGHQAGDEVLATVARRAAATVRAGELLARIGGDEFALLLPEADVEETAAAAERVRQLVGHDPIGEVPAVTVSVGVTDLALGADADGLLRTADEALYGAKAQGRDVVVRYVADGVSERRADHGARRQALLGIGALARAVDDKAAASGDGRHSERVAELAVRLARASGWPPRRLALLREAALVHDVGEIAIPDAILARADRDPAEAAVLREHPRLGAEIATEVLTAEQVAWIRSHHERPDGTGYPDGLAGEAIPPGARLIALANAWDAMTRPASGTPLAPAEALAACRAGAGTRFAPEAVAALERVLAAGELAVTLPIGSAVSLGA